VPAFGLAWLAGWMTGRHPGAAHALAVAVFAMCGVSQLSRLRDRCLAHCRSPLALLLHYGSHQGRFRDLRAGAPSRRLLPGLLLGADGDPGRGGRDEHCRDDRPGRRGADREDVEMGPAAGRAVGVAALALAVAVIWLPGLAPGLHAAPPMMS
jgi:hypothetical protein